MPSPPPADSGAHDIDSHPTEIRPKLYQNDTATMVETSTLPTANIEYSTSSAPPSLSPPPRGKGKSQKTPSSPRSPSYLHFPLTPPTSQTSTTKKNAPPPPIPPPQPNALSSPAPGTRPTENLPASQIPDNLTYDLCSRLHSLRAREEDSETWFTSSRPEYHRLHSGSASRKACSSGFRIRRCKVSSGDLIGFWSMRDERERERGRGRETWVHDGIFSGGA